jgi:hypothetical protein
MPFKIKLAHMWLSICLIIAISFLVVPAFTPVQARDVNPYELANFEGFVSAVSDGRAGVVRGVYVPGQLAARVLGQPNDDPSYVSPVNGVITEFGLAKSHGNIGLLAHNYLAGASFSKLTPGQEIRIVYGDGQIEYFFVEEILRFQALEPNSASSNFIDQETGQRLSTSDLFQRVYTGKRHVTFQTCIYADGNFSWGRLFVIAVPASQHPKLSRDEFGK